jgi:hypothetical protein
MRSLPRYFLASLMMWTGTIADSAQVPYNDPRIERLETFFTSYGCPTPQHAQDYVEAADVFQIDYRVLPAISLLESTCGVNARWNNRWGWNRAQGSFESITEGIAFITSQLADGDPYRDKTLEEKLFTYNPERSYPRKVKRLMTEIEAEPPPADNAEY